MYDTKNLEEMLKKTDQRAESFSMMLNHIGQINYPIVVETGCARGTPDGEDNFNGDGMSTIIFDEFIKIFGRGEFYSVDLESKNVEYVKQRCSHTNVTCSDSILYLKELNQTLRKENKFIDLLYLDSYDLDMENPHPSCLHHMHELTAIMPSLREGSMIVVDDNYICIAKQNEFDPEGEQVVIGKGLYVEDYFNKLGIKKLNEGIQWIWKM